MAPYVFDVNISDDVKSENPVHFAGDNTSPKLDDTTSVESALEEKGQVTISKGGGTEGLFTVVSFWVGPPEDDIKLKFDVYCEMGATHPGQLMNRPRVDWYWRKNDSGDEIVNSRQLLLNTLGNDFEGKFDPEYYNSSGRLTKLPPGEEWRIPIGDAIEQNGLKVELKGRDFDYPNSNCTIAITA